MSEDKKDIGLYNLTKPVIMMFPALFEPKTFKGKGGGEPKFSANFVFDPTSEDLAAMKKVAVAVAKAKHPDIDLKTLTFPFKNGTKSADKRKAKGKDDAEWLRGKAIVVARSKFRPQLGVVEGSQIIDLADNNDLIAKYKGKFYNGVEAYATLNFVWWDPIKEEDTGGVTAYLNMVLSTGRGKRIGGGGSIADTFKQYVGTMTAEDPTEELDDEIPF